MDQGLILSWNHPHLPYNPKLKDRGREMRKNATRWENKLWYDFLRGFDYRFCRQKPINHYIVDFYCPKLKLVIEVDGAAHFTEDGKAYDEERSKVLNAYGLRVLRFTNSQIDQDFETVKRMIYDVINNPPS